MSNCSWRYIVLLAFSATYFSNVVVMKKANPRMCLWYLTWTITCGMPSRIWLRSHSKVWSSILSVGRRAKHWELFFYWQICKYKKMTWHWLLFLCYQRKCVNISDNIFTCSTWECYDNVTVLSGHRLQSGFVVHDVLSGLGEPPPKPLIWSRWVEKRDRLHVSEGQH